MSDFPYDPWQKCQTRSGLAADLVISALQKEIRRNNAENAATLAYEMLITSEDMEEYLAEFNKNLTFEINFSGLLDNIVVIRNVEYDVNLFPQNEQ